MTYGTEYFEAIPAGPGVHRLTANTCNVIDFEVTELTDGNDHLFATEQREYGIMVLTGTVDVSVDDHEFAAVGGRASVFDGRPSMVYAPCGSSVRIIASGPSEVALCSAVSSTQFEPYVVAPGDVTSGTWGTHNTTRHYDFTLDANRPSERLYIAEVTVTSGNWATYPPHKHEIDEPDGSELFQEEMYYYRTDPATGFGFCAVYGGKVGSDHAFMVRDRTILKIPYGYHVITAAPGYKVWYLALYAGHGKGARPKTDPDHAWYRNAEVVLAHAGRGL